MTTTASQTTRSLLLPRGGSTPCSYRIPWPCAGAAPVIVRGESLHRVWCIHAALQQMQQLEHARVIWPGPDTSDVRAALDEISHIVTQRYEALASWGITRGELAPVILAVEEEEIFANGPGHGNQIRDHLLALAVCGAGAGIQIVLGVSWEQTMLTAEVLNSAQMIDLHTTAAPVAEHPGPCGYGITMIED
ncbi:MAG: hypothetical protein M3Y49_10650 [Actinomycetota bacterium]|nr:hypothetical protein [Actinomycetota bacterium]